MRDGGQVRAGRNVELDVRHADPHRAETGRIWRVNADAVAPGADRFDRVTGFPEAELGPLQIFLCPIEPAQQRLQIRHDQRRGAAHDVHPTRRQMELAPSDIHPHVVQTRHQIRVARQSQAHEVEGDRLALIRDPDVHVAEFDDIAEILGGAVKDRGGDCGIIHLVGLPVA